MMIEPTLPAGFGALEPFAAIWAAEDFQARFDLRFNSTMEAIQRFYDVAEPLADTALAYLEQFPLHALPQDALHLYRVLMALAHIAVAVERHKQPRPNHINFPATLRVVQGVFPA